MEKNTDIKIYTKLYNNGWYYLTLVRAIGFFIYSYLIATKNEFLICRKLRIKMPKNETERKQSYEVLSELVKQEKSKRETFRK